MRLQWVPKEADKAYVSNSLWLPKSKVRVGPVKRALEFIVQNEQGQMLMRMWDETSNHIICPREFLPDSEYPKYQFPFVDLRPQFASVEFVDKVTPRNEEQAKAWDAFSRHNNGILNLACGKGKTVLAVKKIAQRKTPTLVIVPDSGILQQWQAAVDRFIEFEGEYGLIQGPLFKWEHPITLALVTTLWKRIEDGTVPEEMFRYFGQVIYDEVHRIGAPKFSTTAKPFYGDRVGLTATAQREDGLDPIYRYHIGDLFYSDLTQQLVPDIIFQQTPATVDCASALVNGVTNISILRTMLGRSETGNAFRFHHIRQALSEGRKVLALGHSKAQLRLLHAAFPGSGLIVQGTKDRMNVLRNNQLVFAIAKLGAEGVDDDALDTLFWLTPFRSKNALQQSMGRIQRQREGKKKPLMVIFEDWMNPPAKGLCKAIRSELRRWAYPFTTNKPLINGQSHFPADVLARYREAEATITEEEKEDAD